MSWTTLLPGDHGTRRLVLLFLLITFVPAVLLVGFGWRALREDRDRILDQVRRQREQAADAVVSVLEQQLESAERSLADSPALPSVGPRDDALALSVSASRVEALPEDRLAFVPVAPVLRETPPRSLEAAEKLEFQERDYTRAVDAFRLLATAGDLAIRAPALVGLARNLRRLGRVDEALAAYEPATHISGVAIDDIPADLFATSARCDLLMSIGRQSQARAEAGQLLTDLRRGRWAIDRTVYTTHTTDAKRWLGDAPDSAAETSALAWSEAAEWVWTKWQQTRGTAASSGHDTIAIEGVPRTIVWASRAREMKALVVGADYISERWIAGLMPMLQVQHLRVMLDLAKSSSGQSPNETTRLARTTGLPWTVRLTSTDLAADLATASSHRTLWMTGLVIVGLLVAAGGYVVARAVARDMAVAKLQSDFVAAVSHEFRTPLTSLKQVSEALVDGRVPSTEDPHEYYKTLVRQTDRLHRLVETLLDFGRMEAGASPYRLTRIDAGDLVRKVVGDFQADVHDRGHEIALDLDGERLRVAADTDALESAVWNLLDNAVKYSPDSKSIEVKVVREASRVAIRVRDQGLGIPLAEQAVIFTKFVRGRSATESRIRGTGVGLALVSHVARGHGGDVRVESTPGLGSTFSILLPVVESPCPES